MPRRTHNKIPFIISNSKIVAFCGEVKSSNKFSCDSRELSGNDDVIHVTDTGTLVLHDSGEEVD